MGYKVHTVDGKSGDVSLLHLRTRMETLVLTAPANGTSVMFRPPYPITITTVRAYRAGGTAGTVQIKNNTSDVVAAPLASATDAWAASSGVQNAAVPAGTTVSAVVAGVTGSPTSLTVQVDYTVDIPA
jgi:hypothetical protein